MGKPEKSEAAPPSYNALPATSMSPGDVEQLNSAFQSLDIPLNSKQVMVDTCLAHLKLLFAFQNLKEAIGYTDGLWQLYDSQLFSGRTGADILQDNERLDDETKKNLSLLREKRWALYVARAVDRYVAWWDSFPKSPLTEGDMCVHNAKYTGFVSNSPSNLARFTSESNVLPPLAYLEDCMRHGLNNLWHQGLPWQLVNEAIDTDFNYKVTTRRMNMWEKATGRKWENAEDSFFKTLPPCPECGTQNVVPWSTCGTPEDSHNEAPSLVGQGYGDGDFKTNCTKCGKILKRDYLEVFRFGADVQNLLAHQHPMPGTLLDNKTGKVLQVPQQGTMRDQFQRTFPNRLIRYNLRSQLYKPPPASMDAIRQIIERALANSDVIKQVERVASADKKKNYRLGRDARLHVRKMMSNYWGNSYPFALELGGAVLRQGIFTEKMYKMDWLHSPAARETMTRLITKYERFTDIMSKNPLHIAVPTLDVDLAWHTHQLSPASYYEWMCLRTHRFIDHDDKIDESKLSTSFEWTSKIYQELYGEVYSECTCWYCESVRTSHVSSIANRLSIFKSDKDKAHDNFYESGRAALCPPDNSAHISAHNSVRITDNSSKRSLIQKQLHLRHQKRLEDNYEKARKRAKRKGRELPPRDDYYYYYWGAPYLLYGPYVYPAYYVCPIYYDSATVAAGSGYYGACAAGTCGGTVAAGACGGAVAGGCGGGAGSGGGSGVNCGSSSGSACGGGGGGGGCGGGGGGGGCGGGGC
ncbi:hypothetical protein F4680DRAFT_452558 [Xylaria scruposa]|nr:hypothetical protein F4680DRAFT_452558 [Xylaria scruposa]